MMSYWEHHHPQCLERRFCELPDGQRKYWPGGFSSRADMCTCDQNPEAEAKRPERAADRRELEDFLGA